MAKLTFRNIRGDLVEVQAVPAARAKNNFAAMLEKAAGGEAVAITRHAKPKAVIVSYAEFEAMSQQRAREVHELMSQFDTMIANMQTPKGRKAMREAYNASPAELGRAALLAARKEKRGAR